MKKSLLTVLLTLTLASASSGLFAQIENEDADVETLKDIYEFCVSQQEDENSEDKSLLKCINEELEYGGFNTFKTIADVKQRLGDEVTYESR